MASNDLRIKKDPRVERDFDKISVKDGKINTAHRGKRLNIQKVDPSGITYDNVTPIDAEYKKGSISLAVLKEDENGKFTAHKIEADPAFMAALLEKDDIKNLVTSLNKENAFDHEKPKGDNIFKRAMKEIDIKNPAKVLAVKGAQFKDKQTKTVNDFSKDITEKAIAGKDYALANGKIVKNEAIASYTKGVDRLKDFSARFKASLDAKKETVVNKSGEVKDATRERLNDTKESINNTKDDVVAGVQGKTDEVKQKAYDTKEATKERTQRAKGSISILKHGIKKAFSDAKGNLSAADKKDKTHKVDSMQASEDKQVPILVVSDTSVMDANKVCDLIKSVKDNGREPKVCILNVEGGSDIGGFCIDNDISSSSVLCDEEYVGELAEYALSLNEGMSLIVPEDKKYSKQFEGLSDSFDHEVRTVGAKSKTVEPEKSVEKETKQSPEIKPRPKPVQKEESAEIEF